MADCEPARAPGAKHRTDVCTGAGEVAVDGARRILRDAMVISGDNLESTKGHDRDPSSDVLLDLDGQVFVIDAKGQYRVRFSVGRADRSAGRPHGLKYSLTLHGPGGQGLVGFDNAHSVGNRVGLGGRAGVLSITITGWRPFDRIGSKTRPHFWRTFGARWIKS